MNKSIKAFALVACLVCVLILLTIFCVVNVANAQTPPAASATLTTDKTSYVSGETINATFNFKNNNIVRPPVVIKGQIVWYYATWGTAYMLDVVSNPMQIDGSFTIGQTIIATPQGAQYVGGSAKINGKPVEVMLNAAGDLVVLFNTKLAEQETAIGELKLIVP